LISAGYILKLLKLVLTKAPVAFLKSFKRASLFFSSGVQSYIGMFLFVIYANKDLFATGKPLEILLGIGSKLSSADAEVAENIQSILLGASGINYVDSVLAIVSATFLILWYLRTINWLVLQGAGDNVPPYFRVVIAVGFYFLTVAAASGGERLPLALLDLVSNLDQVMDASRLNPLGNSSVVNGSANLSYSDFSIRNSTGVYK